MQDRKTLQSQIQNIQEAFDPQFTLSFHHINKMKQIQSITIFVRNHKSMLMTQISKSKSVQLVVQAAPYSGVLLHLKQTKEFDQIEYYIFFKTTFKNCEFGSMFNEKNVALEPTDLQLLGEDDYRWASPGKYSSIYSLQNWQAYLLNFSDAQNSQESSLDLEHLDSQLMPEKQFSSQKVTDQLKHYFRLFSKDFSQYKDELTPNELKSIKRALNKGQKIMKSKGLTLKQLSSLLKFKKAREIMSKILLDDRCKKSNQKNKLSHLMASKIFSLRCKSELLIQRNSIS